MQKMFVFALVAVATVHFADCASILDRNQESPERQKVVLPTWHVIAGQPLEIHPQDLIPENLQGQAIAAVTLDSDQTGVIFRAADAANAGIKAESAIIEASMAADQVLLRGNDITITGTSIKMAGKKEGDVSVAGNHYELEGEGSHVQFEGANMAVIGDAITVEGTSYREQEQYVQLWGQELHLIGKAELSMATPTFSIVPINEATVEIEILIAFGISTDADYYLHIVYDEAPQKAPERDIQRAE